MCAVIALDHRFSANRWPIDFTNLYFIIIFEIAYSRKEGVYLEMCSLWATYWKAVWIASPRLCGKIQNPMVVDGKSYLLLLIYLGKVLQ